MMLTVSLNAKQLRPKLNSGMFKKCANVLSCLLTGISGKSQVLFALVFTTRYLDLLTSFISLYNTTMKVKHSNVAPHSHTLWHFFSPSPKHTELRRNCHAKSANLCLLKDDVC